MSEEGCCTVRVRIALSAVGLIVGLSVFFVFGILYVNWPCAIWALISGVFAALTMGVHIKYAKDQWMLHGRCLKWIMFMGCFGQLTGVCGFITYLTLAIVQQQGLVVHGPGYYLACIWCFMTWKWGFLLFLSSRRYRRLVESAAEPISDVPYQKV